MNNKSAGWTLGIAAMGMMFGLMAADVVGLDNWNLAVRPSFVGLQMAHISVTIAAFIAGKLIPTEPQDQRKNDK